MCADYTIAKCLYVYVNDTDYLRIELYRDDKYFQYNFNVDDKENDTKKNEYNKNILMPQFPPILLYNNHHFIKPNYITKYKLIIDIYLIKHRKIWENITKIILTEERFIDNS